MLIDHHSLLKEPQGTLFGSQDFSKAHPMYLKTTSNSIIYIYIYIYIYINYQKHITAN
jgi:hypothetical protein